jgi:fluoride ion exporter CrcB/FEX
MVQLTILIGICAGLGTFAAYVSFDLEPISAFFHYALYLLVTVGLRFVMQLPLLPGM